MKNLNKVLSLVLSGSMVVSILSTGALAAPASRSSYSDVPATASYSEAVEYLSSEEIMSGTGDGKFDPQVTVTRAQMVTVLGRMAKAQQVESDAFTDVVPNSWYSGYVGWAVESGIVQGDGNGHFMPDDNVTSEHLNLMLSRYAKTIDRDIKCYDTGAPTIPCRSTAMTPPPARCPTPWHSPWPPSAAPATPPSRAWRASPTARLRTAQATAPSTM